MSQIFRVERYLDFARHVAEERLPGVESCDQFGRNPDVGSGGLESLHNLGGLYNWLNAATQLEIISDNAEDSLSGTGAQKVTIRGLDADYYMIEEVVDMNGTTGVTTTKEFLRITEIAVAQAGSDETNVGQIDLQDLESNPNVIERLTPNEGLSHSATITIPAGKRGLLIGWSGSERSKQGVTIEMWKRDINDNVWYNTRIAVLYGTEFERNFVVPQLCKAKTDIELRVIAEQDGAYVAGGMSGYIIDDKVGRTY